MQAHPFRQDAADRPDEGQDLRRPAVPPPQDEAADSHAIRQLQQPLRLQPPQDLPKEGRQVLRIRPVDRDQPPRTPLRRHLRQPPARPQRGVQGRLLTPFRLLRVQARRDGPVQGGDAVRPPIELQAQDPFWQLLRRDAVAGEVQMRIQDEGKPAGVHEELAAPAEGVVLAQRFLPPAGEGWRVDLEVEEVEGGGEKRQRRIAAQQPQRMRPQDVPPDAAASWCGAGEEADHWIQGRVHGLAISCQIWPDRIWGRRLRQEAQLLPQEGQGVPSGVGRWMQQLRVLGQAAGHRGLERHIPPRLVGPDHRARNPLPPPFEGGRILRRWAASSMVMSRAISILPSPCFPRKITIASKVARERRNGLPMRALRLAVKLWLPLLSAALYALYTLATHRGLLTPELVAFLISFLPFLGFVLYRERTSSSSSGVESSCGFIRAA
jgi:hypothetical protein